MAELTEKKFNPKYTILTVFSLFMMFGFGLVVKPWSTVTELGVAILGIYIGVLVMLVCTKEAIWPPLLGLVALVFHGYDTSANVLKAWMGNATLVMVRFVWAICGALRDTKAPFVLANKLMSLKINKGHPRIFLFILFLVTTLLSMLTTGTASILMMYQVAEGVVEAAGYDKDSDEYRFILMGIYVSNIGSYVLPFKGVHLSTLAIATGIMATYGIELNQAQYLFSTTCTVVVFLILYVLSMTTIFKCNLKPLAELDANKLNVGGQGTKFNFRQKIFLGAFVVGVILLFLNSFLPNGSALKAFLGKFGNTWIWIIIFGILAVPHTKEGKPFMDSGKYLKETIMWGTLLMIACINICGQAMSADKYGIKQWLLEVLTPVLGNMSFVVMVIVATVFCCTLTQFLNGAPIAYILNTILIPFACVNQLAGDGNATAVCSTITYCCFFAFITPAASSLAPLITGHPSMTSKFLWTKGWFFTLVWAIIACVFFILFGFIM